MADKKFQDVELGDNENAMEEAAHDPKNAEEKSIDSVRKADGDGMKQAPARRGDKLGGGDKAPHSKTSIVSALMSKLNSMGHSELSNVYKSLIGEDVDLSEIGVVSEDAYSAELDDLIASEATLSEEFKEKTAVIFEAALNDKLKQEITRLEESYRTELEEEVETVRSELVEKVDSYLNYVVETWMEENQVAIENGLRTEIAESFMTRLKDLFEESYIAVPDDKVDLVDDLAEQVNDLSKKLNVATERAMAVTEELTTLKRRSIVENVGRSLADTQLERLADLAESIDFESEEQFTKQVNTLRESFFKTRSTRVEDITEEVADDVDQTNDLSEDTNSTMSRYVSALRRTASKE